MTGRRIIYPLELATPRLLIRSPRVEDAPAMNVAVIESLSELETWMPWADHAPTLGESEQNCRNAIDAFVKGSDHRLHIFLRDSETFVGGTGLHRADWSVPKFEIGYWVRTSMCGSGYASEAVTEVTRFAMETLGAHRVEVRMSTRNAASWRVAEKAGFELEAVLRNDSRHLDGTLRDTKIYTRIC